MACSLTSFLALLSSGQLFIAILGLGHCLALVTLLFLLLCCCSLTCVQFCASWLVVCCRSCCEHLSQHILFLLFLLFRALWSYSILLSCYTLLLLWLLSCTYFASLLCCFELDRAYCTVLHWYELASLFLWSCLFMLQLCLLWLQWLCTYWLAHRTVLLCLASLYTVSATTCFLLASSLALHCYVNWHVASCLLDHKLFLLLYTVLLEGHAHFATRLPDHAFLSVSVVCFITALGS